MIRAPVPTADLVGGHREGPDEAVRSLPARLAEAIRARTVEAEEHYTLERPGVLERAWREEQARRDPPAPDEAQALACKQRVMRGSRRAGMVLFPLAWSGEGWLAWWLGGAWPAALFAALRAASGFLALAWRERLGEVARQARAFLRFLVDRDVERRLRAMADLAPPTRGAPGAEYGG
jgi:hypothetical protein